MLRPVPQANKRRGRHPDKALSAAFRTVAESGRYADGSGLYLHVDPSGARRWVQRLVIRGRSRGLGLGSYALVSLAEARELALANRKLARAGAARWPPSGAPRACRRSRKRPRRWSRSTAPGGRAGASQRRSGGRLSPAAAGDEFIGPVFPGRHGKALSEGRQSLRRRRGVLFGP